MPDKVHFITNNQQLRLKLPVYEWQYQLVKGYVVLVEKGNEPNRFHRFMQRLCLGIKWSKIA